LVLRHDGTKHHPEPQAENPTEPSTGKKGRRITEHLGKQRRAFEQTNPKKPEQEGKWSQMRTRGRKSRQDKNDEWGLRGGGRSDSLKSARRRAELWPLDQNGTRTSKEITIIAVVMLKLPGVEGSRRHFRGLWADKVGSNQSAVDWWRHADEYVEKKRRKRPLNG
jgi:hypothetical protein